jgi:hypothetical protein
VAATTGNVNLNATGVNVDAGTLNLNTNNVLASASGSYAINNLAIAATTLTQASAAVASIQVAGSNGPSVSATVTGGVNLITGDVGDATASFLAAKDNNIKATALGNVMGNTLTVSASTLTPGGSGSTLSRQISGGAESNADFSIVSDQNMLGPVSATATGTVGITTGAVYDSTLSLTGNTLKSLAQANSISNDLVITATQQNNVTASVVSHQGDSDGDLNTATATTAPVGLGALRISTGGLTNASVAITGNTISAVAGKNEAFNNLTVRGSNILGRNDTVSGLAVGTASATGVDFSVINEQLTNTAVTATLNTGASGFVTTGAFSGGSVSLSDNTVAATANANTASNTLTLAATNRLEASGVINNVQALTTSGVEIGASVTGALNVETTSTAGNASVAVAGNVVKAAASANQAFNALNATAANGITSAGSATAPVSGTATPTYAVLNSQSTGSGTSVMGTINGFTMGGAQLSGALNSGGTASVTGNLVQATGYGNSASNAILVSALPVTLNTASASITNVQYNLASVSATVSNVAIQASGTNVSTSSGGVNISGNNIVAMAVGNRAVNTITGR